MHHFQAIEGPDGCAWVAGAWTGPYPSESVVDKIWRYCPVSDEWSAVTDIMRPRGSGGAFLRDGKLCLVSGNVGGHRQGATVVTWFDCYDVASGKWEEMPDVPTRKFSL